MKEFKLLVEKTVALYRKRGKAVHSFHEGYALILEELDEFKTQVWKKTRNRDLENSLVELTQVASLCQIVAEDLNLLNLKKKRKPTVKSKTPSKKKP